MPAWPRLSTISPGGKRMKTLHVLFVVCACSAQLLAQEYTLDTLVQTPATSYPVCIAFSPDNSGKFLFTEKTTGKVRVYQSGTLQTASFATVTPTTGGEQGLLGIALHPQYPDTPYVYLYYTSTRSDRANMVVRYRDSSGVGIPKDTLLVVPRVGGDLANTNHNGGNIHFGPDGKLYVTIGEYGNISTHAQDTIATNFKGKIHRLNPDGTIPQDNPFPGKSFWSFGNRNSFDFTFDAATGKMYCSENGPGCNDEINRVPRGGNLGWPVEGNCTYTLDPRYVRPLYYFPTPPAVTGIVVYRGSAFPRLRGRIIFTTNNFGAVYTLTLSATGDTIVAGSFATLLSYGASGFADVEIGPDGNIYLTNGPYTAHRILRLRPRPPVFTSTPSASAAAGVQYAYTPTFTGTPPSLAIVSGPGGMTIDTTTWTVRWTPTAGQGGTHQVILRAANGAGSVDQPFSITVSTTSVPDDLVPLAYNLEQNFPNPFNPTTRIRFSIPSPAFVRLTIHDLLGRALAVLLHEDLVAGTYTVDFSGQQYSTGVYYYKLEAPGFVKIRSMMLVR